MDHGKRQAAHLVAGELDRLRILAARRDDETACEWRVAGLALPNPVVPTMVLPDGDVTGGFGALSRLQRDDGRRA